MGKFLPVQTSSESQLSKVTSCTFRLCSSAKITDKLFMNRMYKTDVQFSRVYTFYIKFLELCRQNAFKTMNVELAKGIIIKLQYSTKWGRLKGHSAVVRIIKTGPNCSIKITSYFRALKQLNILKEEKEITFSLIYIQRG